MAEQDLIRTELTSLRTLTKDDLDAEIDALKKYAWFTFFEKKYYEAVCAERTYRIPCEAVVFCGPGHQSTAKCEQRGPHKTHYVSFVIGPDGCSMEWTDDDIVDLPNGKRGVFS